MFGGRNAATVKTLRGGSDQEALQPHDQRRGWRVGEMVVPDIDCGGRNHGLNNEVMQHGCGNGRPCDIGLPRGFAARFAMLQAQRGNRGGILAIGHGCRSLSDVLQAGRAGIGHDRLLRQQHEAESEGGEPSPEIEGKTHVEMLRTAVHGCKLVT